MKKYILAHIKVFSSILPELLLMPVFLILVRISCIDNDVFMYVFNGMDISVAKILFELPEEYLVIVIFVVLVATKFINLIECNIGNDKITLFVSRKKYISSLVAAIYIIALCLAVYIIGCTVLAGNGKIPSLTHISIVFSHLFLVFLFTSLFALYTTPVTAAIIMIVISILSVFFNSVLGNIGMLCRLDSFTYKKIIIYLIISLIITVVYSNVFIRKDIIGRGDKDF